jgi:hypothetical protein
MEPTEQRHLEVISRLRGSAEVRLSLAEHVERPHEVFPREVLDQRAQPLTVTLGCNFGVFKTGHVNRQDQKVATRARQLSTHLP